MLTCSGTSSKRNIFYNITLWVGFSFLCSIHLSIFLRHLTVRCIEGLQEAFATGHNTCICRCSKVAWVSTSSLTGYRRQKGMVFYMLRKGSRSRRFSININKSKNAFNQRIFPWVYDLWSFDPLSVHKDKAYDIILDGNGWLMLSMWGLLF